MKRKYVMGIVTMFLAAFLLCGNAWAEGHGSRGPGNGHSQKGGPSGSGSYHQPPQGGGHGPGNGPSHGPGYGSGYGPGRGPGASHHSPPHRPYPGHYCGFSGHHHAGYHHFKPPFHHPKPYRPQYHHQPSSGYFFSAVINEPGFSLGVATGERR